MIDITVALTAHNETLVAGPTIASAEQAIRAAEEAGFTVERLIGLDAPSDACRRYFMQPAFDAWKKVDLECRDLGRSRNALAGLASGRWIAWLDADDLFSRNWLATAAALLSDAASRRRKIIVHPEVNWVFDAATLVYTKPTQDDGFVTPYYFYVRNYYDSLCMAEVETVLTVPYTHYEIANGFAFEDWAWNVETMAAGWQHVAARDTIIFKRRRDESLVVSSARRRTLIWPLEPLAIDRVALLGKERPEPDDGEP